MKTMRKIILVCFCLLAAVTINAQSDFNRLLLSASAESKLNRGMEYGIGVEYILPIRGTNNVGFGIRYGIAQHSLGMDNFSYMYSTVDDEGDNLDYKAQGYGVKERQTFNVLEIPVYYQFRANKIFVNLGPEITIPIKAEYETTEGNVTLSGYYPKYNVELKDLPNHGFGDYNVTGNYGTLETQVVWGVNAVVGYCYSLSAVDINVSIYAKFLMNGYVDEAYYLEYPNKIQSLSYVEDKRHLYTFGLSVGIAL